ncbi:PREDICTED: uncharacterized protein LOC109580630 [Amphimedon queenslandica]|uniref:Uncharacterized protein n=2 Tax=Amphimedon queenslandica TaxID=400682 RepID=A0AAN0IYR7_AMPQE|nr:PREDICTED: uncharacterized protein LOC109580630 [Amphimedon queenslandica]|eukprot:XP_019849593.1 PREDICTED: uncharacterized protein LOC109580630 [Amphimedon queenslandica]
MKCLVCFILVFSLSVAQDCPLPANADIENALTILLLNAHGFQSYSPNITGSVQYVCQAQGNMINTYTEVSLIATYTPNPGQAETTRILSMGCSSGTWSGITQDGLDLPPASVVGVPPRTNCYRCREGFGGDTRCRECDSACNFGLMRCNGSGSGDCCLSFAANGQCSNDLSCTASGPNYVATESNNFTCTCNLTCFDGYTVNSNCTGCNLVSICDADRPCMNGGQCIQYSPPDNYTCTCTGRYQGVNCTVSDLITNGSCPAMVTSIFILNDRTINVPLTEPVCIGCRFIDFQSGDLISFSDGVWRKGSTVLSDGDFSGNVIISSTSNTLFLTLVHPATVVDVGDTLTCSSSSAGQNSIITIGAFNFLNPRVSPNDTVSVIKGSNLTLTCSDPGNSGTPRYVWINDSDGSELTPVTNNPPLTLHLTNINRAASGNYTCRSTNTDLPGVNMDTTVTLNVQSCNLFCHFGYTVNSNCTDCYLVSICDADSPCMNGGQCIQYSPPDNYTCNCTGTRFQGVNCTDRVTNGSCPANATSILVLNDRTINVPLTKPVCIRCRFISNQGDFISFSDGVWRKGSTVLSDGDFSGNVIISNTSNTLFLTLVHPATVVDVGDTLTCSSFSADQQSVITIGAFNFLNPRVSPNGTVSVIEGSNLTLTCSDPGNSGVPRYVWINDSDGSELTPVTNNPPLTLHLTNINGAASGNYTCRSTNTDLPGVNMDTTVTLNVQFPPGILPYIVFNNSTSTVTNITRQHLYSTWRVNAPRPITLLGSAYSSIYISIGGTFSMSGRFNYLYSTLFPSSIHGIRDSVVFAPMWNFYDIRREGSVSYQTFSSNNPLANDAFTGVNNFIRASKNITSYKGIWMLVMEWKDVHPYPHGSYYYYYYDQILERHNTFQAILTTDGSDTHIIYTYKCGDIIQKFAKILWEP